MKTAWLYSVVLVSAARLAAAGDSNSIGSPFGQPSKNWELIRSVPSDFGGTIDFVLVPKAMIQNTTNYQAAAETVAGTRDTCMINFWVDRAQIPTSAWIPVTNLQTMTGQYERNPNYKAPHLRFACWLYPSLEAAKRADAFFMPGVKAPKSEATTNKAPVGNP